MNKIFIIAEAGVNHNGDLGIAKKMVEIAAQSGADAVKFQTFKARNLVSRFAPKAEYQLKTTNEDESHFEMIQKLELNAQMHKALIKHSKKNNIIFISTPFDLESIDMLNDLGLGILKIPSGEIINLPYLRKIGSLGKKIILSTGMADMDEIKKALEVLVKAGTKREEIIVLHCNTEYPTLPEDVNLRAMLTIKDKLQVKTGYSDHTKGIEAAIAAAAIGAQVIEKHFTLDRNMEGPDHNASLEPDELKMMIGAIRNVEKMNGDGIKKASASEQKNKVIARKSIIAARDIRCGEVFSEQNITTKRPATGISPMEWDDLIGRKSDRDFAEDELIVI